MILGFSILASVYATAVVAGLAYQQIDPIVKIVPSIVSFAAKLIEALKERWKIVPTLENMMKDAKTYLDLNQELAQWVLRKFAVRLAFGWGVLALSIVLFCLFIGTLLQTGVLVSVWYSIIVPGLFVLVAVALLWLANKKTAIRFSLGGPEVALESSLEKFVTGQFVKMVIVGRSMLSDLVSVSQIGESLSGISYSEREFIHRYIETWAWLRRMEALLATQGWQKLELETKFLDELMEAAEQLWVKDQYWSARPYYVEVLDCIKRDQRLSDSQYTDDFIRVRLGACYANEGNDRAAIEQFEEALKLSKDNVRQVSAGSDKFKKAIGPIKDAPSFKQFCEKLQS